MNIFFNVVGILFKGINRILNPDCKKYDPNLNLSSVSCPLGNNEKEYSSPTTALCGEDPEEKIKKLVRMILRGFIIGNLRVKDNESILTDSLDHVEFILALEEYISKEITDKDVEKFFGPLLEIPVTVNSISKCVDRYFRYYGIDVNEVLSTHSSIG